MTADTRSSSGTPTRILDAAEDLFASQGIHATSLRSITQRAGVNSAAIHYHFGDKQALVRAIVARRVAPVHQERIQRLERLEAAARPSPEQLLEAYLGPVVTARARWGRRARKLGALMARLRIEEADFESVITEFAEVHVRYARALAASLPGLGVDQAAERLDYAVGAMIHLLVNPAFAADTAANGGLEARFEGLISFLAAGFRAPLESQAAHSRKSADAIRSARYVGTAGART